MFSENVYVLQADLQWQLTFDVETIDWAYFQDIVALLKELMIEETEAMLNESN